MNNIDLIARAHQLVHDGYKYMFNKQLVTVWSAPNYCYRYVASHYHESIRHCAYLRRCGNVAAILQLDTSLNQSFKIFSAVPDQDRVIPPRQPVPYFL